MSEQEVDALIVAYDQAEAEGNREEARRLAEEIDAILDRAETICIF